jgi:glc operon protein GlcG
MHRFTPASCVLAATLLVNAHVQAQQPAPPPAYGPPISLETAKKVMAAAEAEAVKNNWGLVITILDSGGNLVMAHRMDNAPLASIGISRGKARTAVDFKRPSKALEDGIAGGGAGLSGRRKNRRGDRRLGRSVGTGRTGRSSRRQRREVARLGADFDRAGSM